MSAPRLITIRIGPHGAGREMLEKIAAKARDKVGMLKTVGEAELNVTKERFGSKTAPDGSAWAPNAPLTLLLARGGSMMRRSGGLIGSIVYEVSGTTLRLGPNKAYAAIQQFGGTVKAKGKALRIPIPAGARFGPGGSPAKGDGAIYLKSVTIPARPYIGIGPKDEEAILDAMEDWFDIGG